MLTLPIKKKWLDMILSGEKKEEYRDLTPYWTKRFTRILQFGERTIKLRAGYSKTAPEAIVRISLKTGTGKSEWGADPGTEYWVLTIKEVIKQ